MGKSKSENEKTKKYKIEEPTNKKKKKSKNGNEDTKSLKVNKKGKIKKKHKILKRIIIGIILLILIAIMIVAGIVVGIFTSDKYKISKEDIKLSNTNSEIRSASTGETIAILSADENRKWVDLDKMPEYLPKAFVAIEDKRFFEHKGIDITRTLSATINFIIKKGDSSYGGSTITQQLIKNYYDDKDDEGVAGVERKVREMARAYNVEQVLSKDEILELYLNIIFMGERNNGVYTASIYYFNKPVEQLTLSEAAFLAGINHSPNAYNPFNEEKDNSEKIKTRTKTVLAEMKSQGYITDEEAYNTAVAEVDNGLPFNKGTISTGSSYSYHTAALIEQLIKQLMEEEGINRDVARTKLYNNGYIIYSTVDTKIQTRMEEEYAKDKYIFQPKAKDKNGNLINSGHSQSAMAIIDHKTGQVVGVMGGLGEDADVTGTNRATQGEIQPGSSFKPIGVIAPALEEGIITAATVYDDSLTDFGGNYSPHNSGSFAGLLTVRHAIERSSNVVSVKIMAELTPAKAIEYLKNMNIDIDSFHESLPMALGTASVSPLEMAAAYAAIANDGIYITPTFYTKVEDESGKVVLEPKQEQRRVLSVQNAYILKSILTSPVTGPNGTVGSSCRISGIEVAAKTGSTEEYKDRWLCGFTPYYAAATWFGFDRPEKPNGENNARTIWGAVMRDVHQGLPNASFTKPEGIVTESICLDTGCVATSSCARVEKESFAIGTVPKACEGHKKLIMCADTGKIATEFCPNKEEKTFLVKPEKEDTKKWSTPSGKYNVPTENCTEHTVPEKIEVPNVIGKKSDVAKKELEAKGFKVEIKYHTEDKTKEDGVVLRQSVEAGQKTDKGATIAITVNKKESSSTQTNEVGGNKTNTITNTINKTNTIVNNTQTTNTVTNPPTSNIID